MVLLALLIRVGRADQRFLRERLADDLQADGQALAALAARDGDARQAGEVQGDGADVLQVHLQRVCNHLADLEGRRRGRRGHDDIDRLEGFRVVLLDERADLECLEVVGVVVAGGKRVVADHDAALDFLAELLVARVRHHLDEVLAVDALAVADAVVALEVRRSLSRRDEVVRGDRVLRVRQGDLDDFCAELLVLLDGRAHGLFDLRVHALDEVLLRQANLEALDVLDEGLRVVRHLCGARRGVHLIVARNDVEQVRAVRDVARQRADLVKRGRIGDEAVARDAAVRRLHADDAAERSRLADGSARIGAERPDGRTSGDGCGAAARGTARHAVEVPRVVRHVVGRVLRRAAHGEFIHVDLAEDDGILGLDLRHDRRIVRRHEVLEDLRSTRRLDILRADVVLDGTRDALEEGNRLTRCDLLVDGLCLLQRFFARNRQIRLDVTLDLIDAAEHVLRQLDRRDLFVDEHVVQDMRRFII